MKSVMISIIALSFVLVESEAEDTEKPVIVEVYRTNGYVVLKRGNLKSVKERHILQIETESSRIVELVVTDFDEDFVIAEVPPYNSKRIELISKGDLVVAHLDLKEIEANWTPRTETKHNNASHPSPDRRESK